MKILYVYPEFLPSFWSWISILKFVAKKAAFPPIGLQTIDTLWPDSWERRLVDLNVRELTDEDIMWADYVVISAMISQGCSTREVIAFCERLGKPVILGGPILKMGCDKFPYVSHFFPGEAEDTIPEFLADIEREEPKKIYKGKGFPDLANSRPLKWNLFDTSDYASVMLQIGRGCPYRCGFCDVDELSGRTPRLRPERVILADLNSLFATGYRGAILLADDNVMGNKKRLKVILAKIAEWQKAHGYPFEFTGEFPITLADDEDLMDFLVVAGFKKVFLGLESPNRASLIECNKMQNARRNMAECVRRIQQHGLIVMSGFIVGFDNDPADTFDQMMIKFIQQAGIAIAMVGVLQAVPGTAIYAKIEKAGRLRSFPSGNNTDCYPNFDPMMPLSRLVQGYKHILETIYFPREYYKTICRFLENYNPSRRPKKKFTMADFMAFMRANLWIGLRGGREVSRYYWRSLVTALSPKKRRAFADVVAFQIYLVHFMEIVKGIRES